MSPSEIRAYVPPATYLEEKQEAACPQFYDDFAMIAPAQSNSVLASRGLTLKSGTKINLPPSEMDFLERNLLHAEIIAVTADEGILLFFGTLFSTSGLLPVLLPHGAPNAVAYAVACMGENRIRLSPSVQACAAGSKEAETVYHRLADTLSLCDRVFNPASDEDFRLHCAHVAQLSGCKANVTELPVGHYPLHAGDRARWTAFLLCVFLSLRGDSAHGSQLSLDGADRREFRMQLSHQSEHQRKIPVTDTLYRFLDLSAFSNYSLTTEKGRFVIEAKLRRKASRDTLSAPTAPWMEETLFIELLVS